MSQLTYSIGLLQDKTIDFFTSLLVCSHRGRVHTIHHMLSQAFTVVNTSSGWMPWMDTFRRESRLPCLEVFNDARINDAGLDMFPSQSASPEKSWKAISPPSDSKSIGVGGIKGRQAFLCLSGVIPVVFADAAALFHTWQQPLPSTDGTQKGKGIQDNSGGNAMRHPWLILLLDLFHPNKTFQSAPKNPPALQLCMENKSESTRKRKLSHDWKRSTGGDVSLPVSSADRDADRCRGKWGLQAKSGVQSTEPETKAVVQIQTNTDTGEQSFFTSSCCGCVLAAEIAAALFFTASLPSISGWMLRHFYEETKERKNSQWCSNEDNEI